VDIFDRNHPASASDVQNQILPILRRALDCLFYEGRVFGMDPLHNKFHGRGHRSVVLEDSKMFSDQVISPVGTFQSKLPVWLNRCASDR